MKIRLATISDIDQVAPMHMNAWRDAYRGIFPNSVLEKLKPNDFSEKWYSWLKDPLRVNWIVQSKDNFPGFISFGNTEKEDIFTNWEIFAIYIDPNYWGQGIGKSLMTSCMDFLKDNEISQVRLWIVQQNIGAQRFYENLGFIKTHKIRKQERFGISFYQASFIYNL